MHFPTLVVNEDRYRYAYLVIKNTHHEIVPLGGVVYVWNTHVRIVERRRVLRQEPEFQPLKVRPVNNHQTMHKAP